MVVAARDDPATAVSDDHRCGVKLATDPMEMSRHRGELLKVASEKSTGELPSWMEMW